MFLCMLHRMLQKDFFIDFNRIAKLYRRMPHAKKPGTKVDCCSRCFYVNAEANHFCTNCGYPLHNGNSHMMYQLRSRQRADMLQKNLAAIQAARITLYVVAVLSFAGIIGFLFGTLINGNLYALLSFLNCALYLLLARWSFRKPFTALLTAFVIVLSFSTISVFSEFTTTFKSVQGLYIIIFSGLQVYFLLRGAQAAYKADLIKEEMEII